MGLSRPLNLTFSVRFGSHDMIPVKPTVALCMDVRYHAQCADMKTYPSIPRWGLHSTDYLYIFDKLDGSNVRCEIDRKGKVRKFGRRDGLLDDSNPFLLEVPDLIQEKYAEFLIPIVQKQGWEFATFYFEFWGANSFAGSHQVEPHTVTLFDVAPHKKGFLEPHVFLELFGHLDTAKLLLHAPFTSEVAAQVTNSTLEGMTFEGVVCKGYLNRKTGMPHMLKWKSQAWLDRLKQVCKGDEAKFNLLQ